jgi:hypothetical protein
MQSPGDQICFTVVPAQHEGVFGPRMEDRREQILDLSVNP